MLLSSLGFDFGFKTSCFRRLTMSSDTKESKAKSFTEIKESRKRLKEPSTDRKNH